MIIDPRPLSLSLSLSLLFLFAVIAIVIKSNFFAKFLFLQCADTWNAREKGECPFEEGFCRGWKG